MLAFTPTSFILTFVFDFNAVLALRFVQGAALGGVFVPVGLLLFTSLPLNALALGIPWFAMLALSGAALGPLVGGYFSETFGAGRSISRAPSRCSSRYLWCGRTLPTVDIAPSVRQRDRACRRQRNRENVRGAGIGGANLKIDHKSMEARFGRLFDEVVAELRLEKIERRNSRGSSGIPGSLTLA